MYGNVALTLNVQKFFKSMQGTSYMIVVEAGMGLFSKPPRIFSDLTPFDVNWSINLRRMISKLRRFSCAYHPTSWKKRFLIFQIQMEWYGLEFRTKDFCKTESNFNWLSPNYGFSRFEGRLNVLQLVLDFVEEIGLSSNLQQSASYQSHTALQ